MGIKQIITLESDTVSEKTIRIPFEFTNLESVPEGKQMKNISRSRRLPCVHGSGETPAIDYHPGRLQVIADIHTETFDPRISEIMNKYDDVILSIVCIGLHNKKSDPSTWFRDTLKDNCTWEDLRILLNAILFRIGYNPFYKSIMTLKNMSPLSEAEI